MPGADVTVAGKALIGGRAPRRPTTPATTNSSSCRRTYDVEAGFPGFTPARRRIVVRQGETAPLDIACRRPPPK